MVRAALRAIPFPHAQVLGCGVLVLAVMAELAGRVEPVDFHHAPAVLFQLVGEHVPQQSEPVVHRAFAEFQRLADRLQVQVLHTVV